jgi:hypothetical protein
MASTATTLSLIPAPGTLERRLLVDVLAKMARIWIESQRQERESNAEATKTIQVPRQEPAAGETATLEPPE